MNYAPRRASRWCTSPQQYRSARPTSLSPDRVEVGLPPSATNKAPLSWAVFHVSRCHGQRIRRLGRGASMSRWVLARAWANCTPRGFAPSNAAPSRISSRRGQRAGHRLRSVDVMNHDHSSSLGLRVGPQLSALGLFSGQSGAAALPGSPHPALAAILICASRPFYSWLPTPGEACAEGCPRYQTGTRR